MAKTFVLKIYRGTPGKQYWEEFELPLRSDTNVISALMDIRKHPVNRKGEEVAPVVWEDGCLEEVCGSCSMLVNGRPRQACTALCARIIEESGNSTITLAPFSKFPLVRDLIVDRSAMFENLQKVGAWIESDGYHDRGDGPQMSQDLQELRYVLSTCMTCGCCSESCPQVNEKSSFLGPATFAQVWLFNTHPTGEMQKRRRLRGATGDGGIQDCGNAQNCVRVCPKNIPLTDAIAAIGREATFEAFKGLFGTTQPR